MFNVNDIANSTTQAAGDTTYEPIPQGVWRAVIKDFKVDEDQHEKINNGEPFARLTVSFAIDSQEVRDALEREEVTISRNYILDTVTDENGKDSLDFSKGKNVGLNRLRDALGQNVDGEAWSLGRIVGRPCVIEVSHSPRKDGAGVYANVNDVAAVS